MGRAAHSAPQGQAPAILPRRCVGRDARAALNGRPRRCKWSGDNDKKSLSELQKALEEIKVREPNVSSFVLREAQ